MRTRIDRRGFIAAGTSLMIGTAARSALPVIRQSPKARIIIDNDFAGDPDGLIALAHQLATKAARPVLVTTSALDAKLAALGGQPAGATAAAGKEAAIDLMSALLRRDPSARPSAAEALKHPFIRKKQQGK